MLTTTLVYGRVQVVENALPPSLYENLQLTAQQLGWRFGWNTPSNPNSRYWHYEVGKGSKRNMQDVSANVRQHPLPVFAMYQDWLKAHLVPRNTKILRYYLNAHTYGTDGWPHTDTDRSDELTTVLYLNSEWRPEWCGETVVFDAKGDIQAAVLPKSNRLMVFPSDRLHAPRPLSKAFEGLRVVLVVKLGPAEGGSDFFNQGHQTTERESRLLAYLSKAGADKFPHSGRTLLRHLYGLYNLLKMRNAAREVCEAGLFHSVYGTSIIPIDINVQRTEVRELIGERAERLAWLFSQLQRPQCWSVPGSRWPLGDTTSIEVSDQDQADLRLIEKANLDEQGILNPERRGGLAS